MLVMMLIKMMMMMMMIMMMAMIWNVPTAKMNMRECMTYWSNCVRYGSTGSFSCEYCWNVITASSNVTTMFRRLRIVSTFCPDGSSDRDDGDNDDDRNDDVDDDDVKKCATKLAIFEKTLSNVVASLKNDVDADADGGDDTDVNVDDVTKPPRNVVSIPST